MKKWLTAGILASSLFIGASIFEASAAFDEYGLQVSQEQWTKMSAASNWTEMNRSDFVPLTKQWKVTFNQKVKLENIDAAVVEGVNGLLPVKVAIGAKKEILVTPELPYEKDASYELKIALKNGKKFVIHFTTEREPEMIDIEPNL